MFADHLEWVSFVLIDAFLHQREIEMGCFFFKFFVRFFTVWTMFVVVRFGCSTIDQVPQGLQMIEKCLRLAECNENLLLVLLFISTSTRQGLRGGKLPAALRWRAHWARREFNNVLKCTCWSKSPPLNKNDTVLSFPFQDGSIWSVQTTKLY